MFLGLRTVIYPAPDLAASRAWFARLLGVEPHRQRGARVNVAEWVFRPTLPPRSEAQR